jgi:hypothetical protein
VIKVKAPKRTSRMDRKPETSGSPLTASYDNRYRRSKAENQARNELKSNLKRDRERYLRFKLSSAK